MKEKYRLEKIKEINIQIEKWYIIYLNWDLAAWKTTLSKYIINDLLEVKDEVLSPTYTYYNKYYSEKYACDVYHFDLYRLEDYDNFFAIWWEDILDNEDIIALVEWPELIKKYYKPSITINLEKTDIDNEREIEII